MPRFKTVHFTILATFAASIAAIAATIQAYVAWASRNDIFRANIIANVVEECSKTDLAFLTFNREYDNTTEAMAADSAVPASLHAIDAEKFLADVSSLNLLLVVLGQKNAQLDVIDDLHKIRVLSDEKRNKNDARAQTISKRRQISSLFTTIYTKISHACTATIYNHLNR